MKHPLLFLYLAPSVFLIFVALVMPFVIIPRYFPPKEQITKNGLRLLGFQVVDGYAYHWDVKILDLNEWYMLAKSYNVTTVTFYPGQVSFEYQGLTYVYSF